jgi:thiol-disulfide isomerase/thioredoxin
MALLRRHATLWRLSRLGFRDLFPVRLTSLEALVRSVLLPLFLLSVSAMLCAQSMPTNDKARKTYQDATKAARQSEAIDLFKKADKQDGGHCVACEMMAASRALKIGDNKTALEEARIWAANAKTPKEQADAHYICGVSLLRSGIVDHKQKNFIESDQEFKTALSLSSSELPALYFDGMALAHLQQDDAAKARFDAYMQSADRTGVDYARAQRYANRPELARARMAPPFAVTTLNGDRISLDDLTGKVVLIDFWATWCAPCREALPHVKRIAQKFQGEPLVVLSISLDSDDAKWKDFVAKNQMTWLQYRDGGFTGDLARRFNVNSIPHTFTIDADGVLQDEQVGDGAIEGKLKKLIAQAKAAPVERALQQTGAPLPQ